MFFFFFFLSIIVVVTAFLLANRTSFVCFFWVFFFIHRAGAFYGEVERPWVSFCFVFFLPFFCFFLKTIRFNVNRAICMRFACDMPAICMRFAYRRPILIDRRLGPKKGAQNSPTFFCFCFFFWFAFLSSISTAANATWPWKKKNFKCLVRFQLCLC